MPALLFPGMTVTNEPGIYKTGRHGVRTENTMLIVPSQETEFGTYYKFEPLTLCPIDKEAILTDMLSDEEITWFNQYHEKVYNSHLCCGISRADRFLRFSLLKRQRQRLCQGFQRNGLQRRLQRRKVCHQIQGIWQALQTECIERH